jgi:hypothetical protein
MGNRLRGRAAAGAPSDGIRDSPAEANEIGFSSVGEIDTIAKLCEPLNALRVRT